MHLKYLHFTIIFALLKLCAINLFADNFVDLKQPQNEYQTSKTRALYTVYKNANADLKEQVGWLNDGSFIVGVDGYETDEWVKIKFAYFARTSNCMMSLSSDADLKEKIENKFKELVVANKSDFSKIKQFLKNEQIDVSCFNEGIGYIKPYYLTKVEETERKVAAAKEKTEAKQKVVKNKISVEKEVIDIEAQIKEEDDKLKTAKQKQELEGQVERAKQEAQAVKFEQERLKAERVENLRLEREKIAQEKQKLEQEKAELKKLKQEQDEKAYLNELKFEREKVAKEKQRLEQEKAELLKYKREKLELSKLEQKSFEEERAELEKLKKENEDMSRIDELKLQRDKIAQEMKKLEEEKAALLKRKKDKLEFEKLEQKKLEEEKAELAKLEKEKKELESAEKEREEKERIAKEKAEKERLEKEKAELAKLEKEKRELEKAEKERLEKERIAKEKAEKERLEKEKAELAKLEKEKKELEKAELARLEREKGELEKAEKERIEKEKTAAEKAEKLKLEQEKLAQAKLEKEMHEKRNRARNANPGEFCGAPGEVLRFDSENINFQTEKTTLGCEVTFLDCGSQKISTLKKIAELTNLSVQSGKKNCLNALNKFYSTCGMWKDKSFTEKVTEVKKLSHEITDAHIKNQNFSEKVSSELLTCMAYNETKDLNPQYFAAACEPRSTTIRLPANVSDKWGRINYMQDFTNDEIGFNKQAFYKLILNWQDYLKYEIPVKTAGPSYESFFGSPVHMYDQMLDRPDIQLELISHQLNYQIRQGSSFDEAMQKYYGGKGANKITTVKQCASCLKKTNRLDCLIN
ncbi:MAG: hypothetical protein IPM57_10865 [Oligoflexia bacterium]|nr:hypothetical protein [Oligoflexia bacterium]